MVCEATYGDTDRQDASPTQRRKLLRTEVRDATKRRGVLLIPSFAVERTQELLVDLVGLMEASEIPNTPIFIDSPLATKASAIFERHAGEIEDGEALRRALNSPWVRFTESVEQSKAIDRIHSFYIVIAASGMCEAGRIRHHLKAWLWRQEATVLLVGYQAQGTLGRILQDGAARVRIMGEEIQVRARVRQSRRLFGPRGRTRARSMGEGTSADPAQSLPRAWRGAEPRGHEGPRQRPDPGRARDRSGTRRWFPPDHSRRPVDGTIRATPARARTRRAP